MLKFSSLSVLRFKDTNKESNFLVGGGGNQELGQILYSFESLHYFAEESKR